MSQKILRADLFVAAKRENVLFSCGLTLADDPRSFAAADAETNSQFLIAQIVRNAVIAYRIARAADTAAALGAILCC